MSAITAISCCCGGYTPITCCDLWSNCPNGCPSSVSVHLTQKLTRVFSSGQSIVLSEVSWTISSGPLHASAEDPCASGYKCETNSVYLSYSATVRDYIVKNINTADVPTIPASAEQVACTGCTTMMQCRGDTEVDVCVSATNVYSYNHTLPDGYLAMFCQVGTCGCAGARPAIEFTPCASGSCVPIDVAFLIGTVDGTDGCCGGTAEADGPATIAFAGFTMTGACGCFRGDSFGSPIWSGQGFPFPAYPPSANGYLGSPMWSALCAVPAPNPCDPLPEGSWTSDEQYETSTWSCVVDFPFEIVTCELSWSYHDVCTQTFTMSVT